MFYQNVNKDFVGNHGLRVGRVYALSNAYTNIEELHGGDELSMVSPDCEDDMYFRIAITLETAQNILKITGKQDSLQFYYLCMDGERFVKLPPFENTHDLCAKLANFSFRVSIPD